MTTLFQNVLLALVWVMLTGDMTYSNLFLGFVIGYLVLLFGDAARGEAGYFQKGRQSVAFALYFIWEVFRSSLRVAYDVITPRFRARPGIVAIPLDAKTDIEITWLANIITLTPGTMSIDVSTDRRTLYIHALFADDPDAVRREIKEGLERRLLELMR